MFTQRFQQAFLRKCSQKYKKQKQTNFVTVRTKWPVKVNPADEEKQAEFRNLTNLIVINLTKSLKIPLIKYKQNFVFRKISKL